MKKRMRRPRGPDEELPLEAHWEELAERIKKILIVLFTVFIIIIVVPRDLHHSYVPLVAGISGKMIDYVLPENITWMGKTYNVTVLYTSPFGGFNALIYISLLISLLMTSPYIAYHIYEFVSPALYEHEKKKIRGGAVAAVGLFVFGSSLGYFVVAPISMRIMLLMQAVPAPSEHLLISMSMSKVIDFIVKITLTTGLAFEIPLVIYYLIVAGIVPPEKFKGYNSRLAFIIILAIAAIITPDPSGLTMLVLAIPYYLLFLLGVHMGEKRLQQKKWIQGGDEVSQKELEDSP